MLNKEPLLYNEDCYKILKENIEDESIDLVVRSTTYSELRKYEGVINTRSDEKLKLIDTEL